MLYDLIDRIKNNKLLPIILGTGVSSCKKEYELYSLINCCLRNKMLWFDTAPSYGTEVILGNILFESLKANNLSREDLILQTKIDAWQMQVGNIEQFVNEAMSKLHIDYLDVLLIHWPIPEYFDKTWSEFESLKAKNKVKYIGLCNIDIRHLIKMEQLMKKPDIVQIERNPLRICNELKKYCKSKNIIIQAYSPLCKMDERLRNNGYLLSLSKEYNKSIGQIILRWQLDTDFIPIFATTKKSRIEEYCSIFDFNLKQYEIEKIDSMNIDYKMYLESWLCHGF